jgi:hypothetical protein
MIQDAFKRALLLFHIAFDVISACIYCSLQEILSSTLVAVRKGSCHCTKKCITYVIFLHLLLPSEAYICSALGPSHQHFIIDFCIGIPCLTWVT